VAYKRDISDVRESPAHHNLGLLMRLGAQVSYSDRFVPRLELESVVFTETPLEQGLREADCVVIVTDHRGIDYADLVEKSALVVDTRNALRGIENDKIIRL
jgi:UDP-N-acetyl-D-glucosamine dehydrogenase